MLDMLAVAVTRSAAASSDEKPGCLLDYPKGPCTYIVHSRALKLLYRNPF